MKGPLLGSRSRTESAAGAQVPGMEGGGTGKGEEQSLEPRTLEWKDERPAVQTRDGDISERVPCLEEPTDLEQQKSEESPRLSAASSDSNDKLPSAVFYCPEFYDSERPVSVISTASSGSQRGGHDLHENIGDESAIGFAGPDMALMSAAAGNFQAVYRDVQSGLKGGHANHNNNHGGLNKRSRLGSRSLSPFGVKVVTHKLSYVERVVVEIIETERMYVQDLRSIVEDYLGGIIDKQELPMRPEQVSDLFGNIEDIYELNSELLQDLDSCSDDPVAVASCFVEKSQEFDIYTQYCTNYPNSVATLTECMRNKVLAKFFRERQELLNHSLPLGSYLLKPVQRILKYHLLLQEIAKHFDVKEEGYEVVEEAIETMTGVAWYINDMKRKHEHAVRLQEIQSLLLNWKGFDLTTYGELVLEGTFRVQRTRSERTFFLFDKAFFITKKRGDHFVYKTHIPCSSLMLIESTRDSLYFSVAHYKNSKQQHNVQAKTVEEKRVWTHHIKKLILENHHAIIPQKAKEAILEMDAMYPGRYRYSPERAKKTMSVVDPTVVHRSGRRQSEPSKHIVKHLSERAGLKSRESGLQEASKGFKRQNSESSGNPEKRRSVALIAANQEVVGEIEKGNPEPDEIYSAVRVNPSEMGLPAPLEMAEEDLQVEVERKIPADVPAPVDNGETEHVEDLKTFSSEEEEEAAPPESDSILPPSVLNQASVIAERFINNMSRRSSLALDDGKLIGFLTPRLTSRSSSLISLDCTEKVLYCNGSSDFQISVPHQDASSDAGAATTESLGRVNSASAENLIEERERTVCKRRESILSVQDRQLLDKIKSYYDTAENEDAAFCIKRRESLSYIPTGLVRNSVFKINSLPRYDTSQVSLAPQRIGSSSSNASSGGSRPASWTEFPTFPNEGVSKMPSSRPQEMFVPHQNSDPEDHIPITDKNAGPEDQIPITDNEFKSPTEMIKVWEEIEKQSAWKEKTVAPEGRDVDSRSEDKPLKTLENGVESHEPLMILEDSDLSTITEESPAHTPERTSPSQSGNPTTDQNFNYLDFKTPIKLHPKIMQLANCMDGDMSEKMKNKVYQLARQYSQRIKCNKPAPRRLKEIEEDLRRNSLPSVQEEKQEEKGKLKPSLSLPIYDHVVLQEHGPTTPTSASFQEKSPKRLSFPSCDSPGTASPVISDCRSPLSPVKTEKFHWPDVRELRSRYTRPTGVGKTLPVKSQSVPDRMVEHNVAEPLGAQNKDCISHSYSMNIKNTDNLEEISHTNKKIQSQAECAASASSKLNGHMETLQNHRNLGQGVDCRYYVSAEAPLEYNKKVMVMEQFPIDKDFVDPSTHDLESDDTYVHIRSPTTREKISLKAVIERCKAYQESEEYRTREETSKPEDTTEHNPDPTHPDSKQEQLLSQNSDVTQQNRVKNLREKFQTLNSSS